MSTPSQSAPATLRQRLALASVVAAPIVTVIGSGLMPNDTNSSAKEVARFAAHRGEHYLGFALMAVGLWLFIPASTALMRLFRARGSRVGTVGCILAAVGALAIGAGSLLQGTVEMVITDSKVSNAAAVSVDHAANGNFVAGLPWFVGLLCFVGFLTIAGTLLYAKNVPWWQPALLILGVAGVFVGGDGPKSVAFGLPIIAGFVSLAWSISRLPMSQAGEAPAIDLTGAVPSQAVPTESPSRADA